LHARKFLPLSTSEREHLCAIEPPIVDGIAGLFGSGEFESEVKFPAGGAACLRPNPSRVQRFQFSPPTPRAAKRKGSSSPKTPKAKVPLRARATVPSAALVASQHGVGIGDSRKVDRVAPTTASATTETPPKTATKEAASQSNLACSGVDMGGLGRVVQALLASGATDINIDLGRIVVKK